LAVASVIVAAWAAVASTQLRWREPPVARFLSDARATNEVFMRDHALTAAGRNWTDARVRMILAGEFAPSMTGGAVVDAVPPGGHGQVVFATYAIGTSGYALGDDAYVIDMLGLADPLGGRFELEHPGAIGHEKNLPRAWLSARTREGAIPSVFSDGTALSAPLHVSEPGRLDEDAEAARRALDCGALADLSDAVHDDLTVGRFLRNVWEAPRLTRLEVPPDPHEAEARFCG
jgi:arabinofuranosyltransferase